MAPGTQATGRLRRFGAPGRVRGGRYLDHARRGRAEPMARRGSHGGCGRGGWSEDGERGRLRRVRTGRGRRPRGGGTGRGRGHRAGAGVGHLPQRSERARRQLAVPAARRARPRGRRGDRAGRPRCRGMGRGRRRRHPDRHALRCLPGLSSGPPHRLRRGVRTPGPPVHEGRRGRRRLRQRRLVLRAGHRVGPPARRRRGPAAPVGVPARLCGLHRRGHGPERGLGDAGRPGGRDRDRWHRRQRRPGGTAGGRDRHRRRPRPRPAGGGRALRRHLVRLGRPGRRPPRLVRRGHRVQRRTGGDRHRRSSSPPPVARRRWWDCRPGATGRRST